MQVFIGALRAEDHMYITSSLYPSISVNTLQKMITFSAEVSELALFLNLILILWLATGYKTCGQ